MAMTGDDLRAEVQKKFSKGQSVLLCKWDKDGVETEMTRVKIIEFYPNHVLTEHNGYKECYTYRDILKMTTKPERKPLAISANLEKKKIGRYYHY